MDASSGIYTPGSIWAKALEAKESQKRSEAGREDAYVYFVGSRGSGKSTLLTRFLYPSRVEVPKPSQGLEYTFARRASTYGHEHKDLAHIWEVAGSETFTQQLVQGHQVFLSYRQVTTAVVVITVDLSDPGSAISSALHWVDVIKRKLAATYSLFERKGLQLPEQLRARQRTKLYSQHEDKDLINCSGISIIIAATKWDTFRDSIDPEGQKVIARTLRCIAHSNSCHLVYLGGLHPGGLSSTTGSADKQQSQQLLGNFSRLLNHLMFVGIDRKMPLKLAPQFDHLQAISIPAGSDRFRDIGRPNIPLAASLTAQDVAAMQQEWVAMTQQLFPDTRSKEQRHKAHVVDARYSEEDVDNARARREAALEAYRQEVESAKRQEAAARKHKATAAADPANAAPAAGGSRKVGASPGAKSSRLAR